MEWSVRTHVSTCEEGTVLLESTMVRVLFFPSFLMTSIKFYFLSPLLDVNEKCTCNADVSHSWDC